MAQTETAASIRTGGKPKKILSPSSEGQEKKMIKLSHSDLILREESKDFGAEAEGYNSVKVTGSAERPTHAVITAALNSDGEPVLIVESFEGIHEDSSAVGTLIIEV
jgi:hypothetical protein